MRRATYSENTINRWIAKEAEVMELHEMRKGVSGHLL
jgi:hypothetical protein